MQYLLQRAPKSIQKSIHQISLTNSRRAYCRSKNHFQMIQSNTKANFNKKYRVFTNKRNLSESIKTDSLVDSKHTANFFSEQHINISQLLFGTSKKEQKFWIVFSIVHTI